MADYISREAAKDKHCQICRDRAICYRGDGYSCPERKAFDLIPATDVRPVDEISDSVDEAIGFLSSVSNQMPYHVYSALFDLICAILPNCGADMRAADDRPYGERAENEQMEQRRRAAEGRLARTAERRNQKCT